MTELKEAPHKFLDRICANIKEIEEEPELEIEDACFVDGDGRDCEYPGYWPGGN